MDLRCDLCPHACVIPPGAAGDCRIRVNLDGKLRAVTYGYPVTAHVDPIEKKPLYHFKPGSSILSVATVGCNLHCLNCQNHEISQADPGSSDAIEASPEALIASAKRIGSPSIAYTYTEPLVSYEYTLAASRLAREAGLGNVLVTAGYLNRAPLEALYRVTDAANIDLKAFSDSFYREVCGATLAPVLDALVLARAMGVHLEVTNLVIPTLNDSPKMLRDLSRWVSRNLGVDTPLHVSAFRPQYRMQELPPTPLETLVRAREIAREEGLRYVYIGNALAEDSGTTRCGACGYSLIKRRGYRILHLDERLSAVGRCSRCGETVPGVWR
jgi:pyruvate formate lyase activating enzyme